MTDFSKQLIRCSSISDIMTNPRSKSELLSETCKTRLQKIFRETKYNRKSDYSNKYIEKGLANEEDAISLLSLQKKKFYKKNTERITNQFLSGEPDLIPFGEDIYSASEGFDTKCSFDLWTFPFPDDELIKSYYFQNMGYMALTGAKQWTTVYCLTNSPTGIINNEKKAIWYRMGWPGESWQECTHPEYVEKCIEVEKNMIFDINKFTKDNPDYELHGFSQLIGGQYDIPQKERIMEFVTLRDDSVIQSIYDRVVECRKYLMTL